MPMATATRMKICRSCSPVSGSGAFRPGRYVKTPGVPISNLFLSMADAMGAKHVDSHGDSTGRLTV